MGILIAVVIGCYGLLCLGVVLGQRHLIFVPKAAIDLTPADFDTVPYEDITIGPPDQHLSGWWIPAPPSGQTEPRDPSVPKVVLYLHGNYGSISDNAEHAARFHRWGYAVLLMDYRGFGQSSGPFPSEDRLYVDAATMWQALTVTRRIPPENIVIYGHSLGGAIAIHLAVAHPEAAGLIVESSFTSMLAMGQRDPWFRLLPLSWLLHQRFDSLSAMPQLQMPVLVIHGTADTLIPISMGEQLFAAAPTPRYWQPIVGGGHNTNAAVGGSRYEQAVKTFIASCG